MTKTTRVLCLLTVVGLVSSLQAGDSKWSLKFDVGLAMPGDIKLEEMDGVKLPLAFNLSAPGGVRTLTVMGETVPLADFADFADSLGLGDVDINTLALGDYSIGKPKLTLDPGIRFDLGLGYNFTKAFSVEIESGLIYNSADEMQVTVITPTGPVSFKETMDEGAFYQVPVLANFIYTLPLESKFKPFVGLGAGGVFAMVDTGDELENDFVFAYQAMAGCSYAIRDNFDVGISYKFLGASSPEFDGVKTSDIFTHSILAQLNYRF